MTPPAEDLKQRAAQEGRRIGPLAGIRVIELGTLLAGPFAGRLLGDLGERVRAADERDPLVARLDQVLPGEAAAERWWPSATSLISSFTLTSECRVCGWPPRTVL